MSLRPEEKTAELFKLNYDQLSNQLNGMQIGGLDTEIRIILVSPQGFRIRDNNGPAYREVRGKRPGEISIAVVQGKPITLVGALEDNEIGNVAG